MKKFYALMVGLVLLVSLSSLALAKVQYDGLLLSRIIVLEDNPIVSSIEMESDFGLEYGKGRAVVSIPELGLRSAGRNVNVRNGQHYVNNLFLDVPYDVPAGEYYLRFVVSNDETTRIKHRLITIG